MNRLHTGIIVLAPPAPMRQNRAMQSASTHGHAILNYIIDQGGQVSMHSLREWARAAHGENARYHTCSVEGLALDEILRFLSVRDKITIESERVSVNVQNICGHEEHPSSGREP